jgi:putative ABC transport system permease protein
VLTVTAGLLINSFGRLTRLHPGFATNQTLKAKVSLTTPAYGQYQRRLAFQKTVLDQIRVLPGVRAVGAVSRFPLHDSNVTTQVAVEGTVAAPGRYPEADLRHAAADYFGAMSIPVLSGRTFTPREATDSAATLVAIINRTAARTIFGTENAVGRRMQVGGAAGRFYTIVGVVGDVFDASLRAAPRPQVYVSALQAGSRGLSIVVRFEGPSAPLIASIRRIVGSFDPSLPVYDVQTIEDVMAGASRADRFTTSLLSSFSFLALILAALGTFGVIAHGVATRTREIGVRLALGARGGDVLTMVLREGLVLLAIALPIAFAGVWAVSRAIGGLLFNVAPTDPVTLISAAATMAGVTLLACYLPALRASRVDPTVAMRAAD